MMSLTKNTMTMRPRRPPAIPPIIPPTLAVDLGSPDGVELAAEESMELNVWLEVLVVDGGAAVVVIDLVGGGVT